MKPATARTRSARWRAALVRARRLAAPSMRRSLLALVVALPPLYWVVEATKRAALSTLGRDQGIFQYVAWAMQRGAVEYRDVHDVNGPLIHWIHMAMLGLGGHDEHVFRSLDLFLTGLTFAIVGYCLPGIATSRRVRWSERAAWAFAAWVVLSGQYLRYLYWDLAQRESFCDWFVLTAIGIELVVLRRIATAADRGTGSRTPNADARGLALDRPAGLGLFAAGALLGLATFGKPTFAIVAIAQLFAVAWAAPRGPTRRASALLFIAGGLSSSLLTLALVAWRGDVGAFVESYFFDPPRFYRYIATVSLEEILSKERAGTIAAFTVTSSALSIWLIVRGELPRRAIAVALLPLAGLASVIVQAKGFPYHFHPVTAGLTLVWLMIVVWLGERRWRPPFGHDLGRWVPGIAAAALAMNIAAKMPSSPHIRNLWILDKGATAAKRRGHDYLVYYRDRDFFPWEMRQAARFLEMHTDPDDKVQVYGMDPYVLFLAQRLSASRFIYAYDLNADSAIRGARMPNGPHPTPFERGRIAARRDQNEDELRRVLEEHPPAAFVFIDKSPLITHADAWRDFQEHCPRAAAIVRAKYVESSTYREFRVWLRRDRHERFATKASQLFQGETHAARRAPTHP